MVRLPLRVRNYSAPGRPEFTPRPVERFQESVDGPRLYQSTLIR